ncbi:hypothetical protein Ancab_005833 [Ancistrocladus abbreviatus]
MFFFEFFRTAPLFVLPFSLISSRVIFLGLGLRINEGKRVPSVLSIFSPQIFFSGFWLLDPLPVHDARRSKDNQPLFADGASSRFTYFQREACLDMVPSFCFNGHGVDRYENLDDAAAAINGLISFLLLPTTNFFVHLSNQVHLLFLDR